MEREMTFSSGRADHIDREIMIETKLSITVSMVSRLLTAGVMELFSLIYPD
jgi:hypothetical protein